jgi:hypothetical protein
MMYDPNISDLERVKSKIKGCKRYKGMLDLFSTDERFAIPIDSYIKEVRTMFKMRKFRGLDVNDPKFTRRFAEAIVQDQSYRSRMTEMLTQCYASKRALDRLLDIFYDYAIVEFSRELKILSTAKERESLLKSLLNRFNKYSVELDSFIQEVDYLVKDIDKAGYAAKNIAEVYAIVFKKEGSIPAGNI